MEEQLNVVDEDLRSVALLVSHCGQRPWEEVFGAAILEREKPLSQ